MQWALAVDGRLCTPEGAMVQVEMRPARPDEAAVGGHLIFLAAPTIFSYTFALPPAQAEQLLVDLWPSPMHLLSHQWTHMAVVDGAVLGLQLAYPVRHALRAGLATARVIGRRFPLRQILTMAWHGWAVVRISAWMGPSDYYLAFGSVLPEARSRGVGRQMLAFGEEEARRAGCKRCLLDVFVGNDRARALVEECGFRLIAVKRSARLARTTGYGGVQRLEKPLP